MTNSRAQSIGNIDIETLGVATASEVVEMALSDHVSFGQIRALHGLSQDHVEVLMRTTLKPSSYRAWRRRVRQFNDRRAHCH
jgi:uncharacterized protein (TIGR03643 family)